jgi:hypothetical protein
MRDPCACAGGRAAFRVMAPDAHEAQLRIGMGSGMAKGDDGGVDRHDGSAGGGLPPLFSCG